MSLAPRLLGLAFSSADALLEIDEYGIVRFALGAGPTPNSPTSQWVGQQLTDRFDADSAARVQAALKEIKSGTRCQPIDVTLDCGLGMIRPARFSAFKLPELAPSVSCSLVYVDAVTARPSVALNLPDHDPQSLLAHLRHRLISETPQNLQRMAFAFVDVVGMEGLSNAQREDVQQNIVSTLLTASLDGNSATQLTNDRFALVRRLGDESDLAQEVRAVGELKGVPLSARTGQSSLGADGAAALRAMRFAIEACLREDGLEQPELGFADTLARTLRDADRFRTLVRDRDFALFYQPIVDLKSRTVHHFEALSRFPKTTGPAAAIRMAEELGLIEAFDRTVAEMAVRKLRAPGGGLLKIGVNVSGASLANDAYITALLAMTASAPDVRNRLMVEVTETAALADLASANRRLTALREVGIRVCIDDFGAGSASFDYLRGLNVDIVKIDGSLVKDVVGDPRSRTLIGHLVDLCGALGIDTVAEMVETEEQAMALSEIGVTHAQGWLFGRAEAEPRTILSTGGPVAARRLGATESWG